MFGLIRVWCGDVVYFSCVCLCAVLVYCWLCIVGLFCLLVVLLVLPV